MLKNRKVKLKNDNNYDHHTASSSAINIQKLNKKLDINKD